MRFHIPTMTCGHCVQHVRQAIATVDPDAQVEADIPTHIVTVTGTACPEALAQALAADGYEAQAL